MQLIVTQHTDSWLRIRGFLTNSLPTLLAG